MSRRGGRCLCGAVRYEVDGPLRDVIVCHCVECRRWAGSAWAATAARRDHLAVVAGEESLRWHPSPASVSTASRANCAACGAALFWDAPGRATVSIAAGTLDDASGLELAARIYVAQAQPWEPLGTVPAYSGGYPGTAPPLAWH